MPNEPAKIEIITGHERRRRYSAEHKLQLVEEGRGWRGFHHHATLCIAAYGFLVSEREAIPPSGPSPALVLKEPPIPGGYRPRGSPHPT